MGAQSKPSIDQVTLADARDELLPGTLLMHGNYVINDYLGADGFGITYLASDRKGRHLVIKECFPGAFCRRQGLLVQPRSPGHDTELGSIVRLFAEEALKLSKLGHPNIVGIHDVFEENQTAYIAMDFVDGSDFLEILEDESESPTPAQIRKHLSSMLEAISFVHRCGMLHRDISPDNIIVRNDGEAILIDFAAAREQATKASRILSVLRVVKDGYSPQEFYISGSEQGPSCDLYSLAASFYHIITGMIPPGSQQRLAARASGQPDPYVPLSELTDEFDADFCAALDKAISVIPHERFQSADEWVKAIRPEVATLKLRVGVNRPESATPDAMAAETAGEIASESFEEPIPTDGGSVDPFGRAGVDVGHAKTPTRPVSHFTEFRQSVKAEQTASGSSNVVRLLLGGTAIVALAGAALFSYLTLAGTKAPFEVAVLEPSLQSPGAAAADETPRLARFEPVARTEPFVLPVVAIVAEPHGISQEILAAPESPDPIATDTSLVAALPAGTLATSESETLVPVAPQAELMLAAPEATPNIPEAAPSIPEAAPSIEQRTAAAEVALAPSKPADAAQPSTAPVVATIVPLLPFTAAASDKAMIDTVSDGAPTWMENGQRVVSINGVPVESLDQIAAILADELASNATEVEVSLGIVEPFKEAVTVRNLRVPVAHKVDLSNGLELRVRFENAAWVTRVARATEDGTLEVGDVVVGLVRTSQRFDDPRGVTKIIETELMAGRGGMALAVERNGLLLVETFAM